MNQVNEKKTEKKTTKIHNQIIYSLLVDSDSLRIFKNLTKQRSNENEEEFLGDCCCCIEQWPESEYTKTRARTQYRTLSAVYFRSTWFWFDLIQISIEKWNRNKKKILKNKKNNNCCCCWVPSCHFDSAHFRVNCLKKFFRFGYTVCGMCKQSLECLHMLLEVKEKESNNATPGQSAYVKHSKESKDNSPFNCVHRVWWTFLVDIKTTIKAKQWKNICSLIVEYLAGLSSKYTAHTHTSLQGGTTKKMKDNSMMNYYSTFGELHS